MSFTVSSFLSASPFSFQLLLMLVLLFIKQNTALRIIELKATDGVSLIYISFSIMFSTKFFQINSLKPLNPKEWLNAVLKLQIFLCVCWRQCFNCHFAVNNKKKTDNSYIPLTGLISPPPGNPHNVKVNGIIS